ncbi:peptide methionine sulfoxide reductase msrA/msrB [Paenibacillus sp. RU4T]|nr:peptide methionine sulfoxide reductase msrA/msrB [Paenibacillus sp. RU4X]SIR41992.1 peptide methionine sulfoxide reductase msrA/msrB [Paenibacillus sp. RU4T]
MSQEEKREGAGSQGEREAARAERKSMTDSVPAPGLKQATFAGGCFWCMVQPFEDLPGIESILSGYTGGHTDNPTYDAVASETTGHAEAVRIVFDPDLFPYVRLLDIFWRQIDPTDAGGQFQDRGASYRSAIFYHDDEQRRLAEASRRELQSSRRFKGRIVTEIVPAGPFYPAEEEHQDYHRKSFGHYRLYRQASGRDEHAAKHWPALLPDGELRRRLSPLQYEVIRHGAQEPPYDNPYWNNKEDGIYVDAVGGDPLFSTMDQFDAGDGWPAFRRPLHEGLLRREADLSTSPPRIRLKARLSGSCLGHLLGETGSKQGGHYRINSAALRFVPKEELAPQGYAGQLALWDRFL